jgi:hypothetical protein
VQDIAELNARENANELQRSTLNIQLSTFKSSSDASVIYALSFPVTFLLANPRGNH